MDNIAQRLKAYIEAHPFDPGDSDCETVLDQLYQVYQESHESRPTGHPGCLPGTGCSPWRFAIRG